MQQEWYSIKDNSINSSITCEWETLTWEWCIKKRLNMNYPKMTPPPTKELKTSLLYRSVTCWSSLINTSQEAPKEPENPGPQTSCPLSLLPHILLSQHNPSYQWPPKLLQGLSQRALPNTILLSHFPNLLRNPEEELEDPFLLDLIDLTKLESEPPSLMLFRGTSNAKE